MPVPAGAGLRSCVATCLQSQRQVIFILSCEGCKPVIRRQTFVASLPPVSLLIVRESFSFVFGK